MEQREYKVGDVVWWVAGYGGHAKIAIRCTSNEVENYWREKHGQDGVLEYWLDEPVGHALQDYDLYDTREEAAEELRHRYEQWVEHEEHLENARPLIVHADLTECRRQTLKFIYGTWERAGDKPEEIPDVEESLKNYPDKKHGDEWFNLADLGILHESTAKNPSA